MIALLLLFACGFFQNTAPILVAVNEVPLADGGWLPADPALAYTPGEPFALRLTVDEPDGDRFRVWWPYAPGGLDFDPDGTEGVWTVPPTHGDEATFTVLIQDVRAEAPRSASWGFTLLSTTWDGPSDTGSPPPP